MTLILRQIEASEPWMKFEQYTLGNTVALPPPIDAIRSFVPSEADRNGLSVFEVQNDEQIDLIVAAMAFPLEKMGKKPLYFACAKRGDIEMHGFEIVIKKGRTRHSFADLQHREIMIYDFHSVETIASIFLNGELRPFEAKTIMQITRDSARANYFDYTPIASAGLEGNWKAKHLLKFIEEKVVRVHGLPSA